MTGAPDKLDTALSLLLDGREPDLTGLTRQTIHPLLAAVEGWEPEEVLALQAMEPVWQIARWLALDPAERASHPSPLQRPPTPYALRILTTRIDLAIQRGRIPPQKQVAEHLGLNRVRVLEVVRRLESLLSPYRPAIDRFRQWLRSTGLLLPVSFVRLPSGPRLDWSVAILLAQFGIDLNLEEGSISGYTQEEVTEFLDRSVAAARRDRLAAPYHDEKALQEWVRELLGRRRWSPAGEAILRERIKARFLGPDQRSWRDAGRPEHLEHILAQYPNGFALYREVGLLQAKLEELFGVTSRPESIIQYVTHRVPRIHLWGPGLYVHERHIPAPTPLLQQIVAWILGQLGKGFLEISTHLVWERFGDQCRAAGLPTPEALYTWIRLHAKDRLGAPRYPILLLAGEGEHRHRRDLTREYLRQSGPVSRDQLRAYLGENRAWRADQLMYALHYTPGLYLGDDGRLHLTEWTSGRERIVERMRPALDDALAQAEPCSLLPLYHAYAEELCSAGIPGPRTLWGILREGLRQKYRFGHYPLIGRQAKPIAALKSAIATALQTLGAPATRAQIEAVLRERFALEVKSNSLSYFVEQLLLYRGARETYFYIHRDWLAWDQQKQAQLDAFFDDVRERLERADPPVGLIEELLCQPSLLPPLGNGLEWTVHLLVWFLRQRADLLVVGSRRRLLVPAANRFGITTDLDLAGFILAQEFGPKARLDEWKAALVRLQFCFELPRLYQQNPNAPFTISADWVRLRTTGERWLRREPRLLTWRRT